MSEGESLMASEMRLNRTSVGLKLLLRRRGGGGLPKGLNRTSVGLKQMGNIPSRN